MFPVGAAYANIGAATRGVSLAWGESMRRISYWLSAAVLLAPAACRLDLAGESADEPAQRENAAQRARDDKDPTATIASATGGACTQVRARLVGRAVAADGGTPADGRIPSKARSAGRDRARARRPAWAAPVRLGWAAVLGQCSRSLLFATALCSRYARRAHMLSTEITHGEEHIVAATNPREILDARRTAVSERTHMMQCAPRTGGQLAPAAATQPAAAGPDNRKPALAKQQTLSP